MALADAHPCGLLGLGLGEHADLARFGFGHGLDGRGLLEGALVLSTALVGLNGDGHLAFCELGLLGRDGLGLAQFALLLGSFFLLGVGHDAFLGHLAGAELFKDLLEALIALGALGCADQNFLEFEVVLAELFTHLVGGLVLDLTSVL